MPFLTNFPINIEKTRLLRLLLGWADSFNTYCFLNANDFANGWAIGCSLACGVEQEISYTTDSLSALDVFHKKQSGRIYGFLSYDLKNELEELTARDSQQFCFPRLYFFLPQYQIHITGDELSIETRIEINKDNLPDALKRLFLLLAGDEIEVNSTHPAPSAGVTESSVAGATESSLAGAASANDNSVASAAVTDAVNVDSLVHGQPELQFRESRNTYLKKAAEIYQHIKAGDIYELNFCQEFFIKGLQLDSKDLYERLNEASPAPFSLSFKYRGSYILSSSMERFLKREGSRLKAQPIKGTSKRGLNALEDALLSETLRTNEKERAENIMIVDLVRNDLAKVSVPGTVSVDELAVAYPFAQVHQLISTISAEIKKDITTGPVIQALFPMGSMTGAPKLKAMQLIDRYEAVPRGLYSGLAGYIDPNGDFDFSVLIRTILYDPKEKYLSFHTGSALTSLSDHEEEYKECLLKASGMIRALKIPSIVT